MMDRIIDTDLISHVEPHWARGYEKGLTHEQTAEAANDTYCELERFYDRFSPRKWPEGKPEYDKCGDNEYLVYDGDFVKATYHPDGYFYYYNADGYVDMSEPIYWWNLPEVRE